MVKLPLFTMYRNLSWFYCWLAVIVHKICSEIFSFSFSVTTDNTSMHVWEQAGSFSCICQQFLFLVDVKEWAFFSIQIMKSQSKANDLKIVQSHRKNRRWLRQCEQGFMSVSHTSPMIADTLSGTIQRENSERILLIRNERQWTSPMSTTKENKI